MSLINGTTHEVVRYDAADCSPHPVRRGAFLRGDAQPALTVVPGSNLNARKASPEKAEIDGWPVDVNKGWEGADEIPGGDGLVFCSNMYKAACRDLGRDVSRLACPAGPVYEDESATRPCGITKLEVG